MKHLILTATLLASSALAAQTTSAVSTDPAPDARHPAKLVEVAVPSHGEQLLGAFYLASGEGLHPTAIIFHGFPGFEQNLDLAQALRRNGYNVLAVHYRGSWGVKGGFSYAHSLEDADAEVAWLTSPEIAAQYNVDTARLVVIGHSLGGFIAGSSIAHNPKVAAAVLISSASIGHRFATAKPEDRAKSISDYAGKTNPVEFLVLSGTSPDALGGESFDHRGEWELFNFAPAIGKRPTLLITANDGSGPNSEALLQALVRNGSTQAKQVEIPTDHPFSDHRIALETTIIDWLNRLPALHSSEHSQNTIGSEELTTVAHITNNSICGAGHASCAP